MEFEDGRMSTKAFSLDGPDARVFASGGVDLLRPPHEVYAQVARVLVPGGLYVSDYAMPLLYMAENRGWDGEGYTLYVREPYVRGAILETEDGVMNYAQGESYSEFHHLLSDIVNGLVAEGLIVRGLWENPRPGHGPSLEELEPGSPAHQDRYLPFGLTLIAEGTE